MKRIITALSIIGLLLAFASPVLAQNDEKAELRARFKQREAQLREQKKEGRVGETIDGYVELVVADGADDTVKELLKQENDDRLSLYTILAIEVNAGADVKKVTPATVAARNARRNIKNASPDEFVRVAKDHWIRVKDFPRHEELKRFKAKGTVGETSDGLVEAVKPDDAASAPLAGMIKDENETRTAEYKALAEKEKVEVSVIAKRMAKRNFENARVGDMFKDESGSWKQK